jgi:hypothetical protein
MVSSSELRTREINDFVRNVKREWIRNARFVTVNNERSLIEAQESLIPDLDRFPH